MSHEYKVCDHNHEDGNDHKDKEFDLLKYMLIP